MLCDERDAKPTDKLEEIVRSRYEIEQPCGKCEPVN